ncbi:retrotransposon gag protein [Penicillium soppii]|uniref:retrotransposon gag protein n=1 Tax=Penicillium soppii TaxID=69789 RepID=UPI0025480C71|nr:retrotransposon gag protein [Penicillium soppii]KAJ5863529.1 retrotransposon gag protein [Penicillium soppii]
MESQEQQQVPQWAALMMQRLEQNQQAHDRAMEQQAERIRKLEGLVAQIIVNNKNNGMDGGEDRHRSATETPSEQTNEIQEEPHRLPRPRLPDPALFAGSVKDWPTWRITIENKLAIDGPAIGSRSAQFVYVFSRLEKLAWKNTGTFVKHRRDTAGPEDLIGYLETIYGDPNAQARAARRLHQITQAEGTAFSKFLPRLEKEFADAGALDWPDEAKRQILLGSLNSTMSGPLMNRGIPATFSGLVSRLHEISTDIDALNSNKPSSRRTAKLNNSDEMDWTPTITINRTDAYEDRRRIGTEQQPKRARWASEDEMHDRRREGRCLRCGKTGCRIAECPYLPAKRPESNRVAASSANEEGRFTAESEAKPKRKTRVRKSKPVAESESSNDEYATTSSSESETE